MNVTSYAAQNLLVSTTYAFRVRAVNGLGKSVYTNTAAATTAAQPPALDFSNGFLNAAGPLKLNGKATLAGTGLRLTDTNLWEASSAFSANPVAVNKFTSRFTFQLTNVVADGFAFVLQNNSPSVVGAAGGGLAYQGIGNSAAIKFDLWSNNGEGPNSTGLFTNGRLPTVPSVNLANTGIDLHDGDVFQDDVSYDGATLTNTITDTKTGATATQTYAVNLPAALGSGTAYVGFTGSTGGAGVVQDILTWTYTPTPTTRPAAADNLQLLAASGTQINLGWRNNATNQAGFKVMRSTDGVNYTQVAETAADVTTYMDGGLTPNQVYYYEIVATNGVGDAAPAPRKAC